jgi:hypothetical protein
MPRIVVDERDPRVVERPLGMVGAAEANDDRIDFHGVDAARAVPEGGDHIGPRSGAEDEDVLEGAAEHGVGPLVEVLLLLERRHRLVEDVVHFHDDVVGLVLDGDLVVRRPDRAARHDGNEAQRYRQQDHTGGDRGPQRVPGRDDVLARLGPQQQRDGRRERGAEPHGRRQLEPGDEREGGNTRKAAGEIDRVGPKRRQHGHLARHALRRGRQQERHRHEHDRQEERRLDDRDRFGRSAAEVDAARRGNCHLQPERIYRRDEGRHQDGKPRKEAHARGREEAPDADPEKRREQDEVGEVGEQPDVGRHPPNQRNFDEQNEKGGEEDHAGGGNVPGKIPGPLRTPGISRTSVPTSR